MSALFHASSPAHINRSDPYSTVIVIADATDLAYRDRTGGGALR
jgi:hypothetical protein